VAKIAGVPNQVIDRANELMRQLEVSHNGTGSGGGGSGGKGGKRSNGKKPRSGGEAQLPLFTQYVNHPALEQLRQADLENLTPIQAFELLRKLREQLEKT
jgi:DNA mismatch repair protein MutS